MRILLLSFIYLRTLGTPWLLPPLLSDQSYKNNILYIQTILNSWVNICKIFNSSQDEVTVQYILEMFQQCVHSYSNIYFPPIKSNFICKLIFLYTTVQKFGSSNKFSVSIFLNYTFTQQKRIKLLKSASKRYKTFLFQTNVAYYSKNLEKCITVSQQTKKYEKISNTSVCYIGRFLDHQINIL